MAKEVTVDAKPMPKLPYDPDVIPPAVKRRAAAVDALYSSTAPAPPKVELKPNGSDGSAATQAAPAPPSETPKPAPHTASEPASVAPQVPDQQVSAPLTPPPAPAEPSHAPPPPDDENSPTWRGRAVHEKGRREGMERQIAALQDQMVQMGNELLHAQRLLQERAITPPPPPPPPQNYLTEQDEQQYGRDLIDFTQRAATQAVAPHLQRLDSENAELRSRLAREARHSLDQQVELAVPNYRDIDRDPRWHRWLMGIDLFSGRVRQQLLNEAIAAASAPRVISFFKGFLNEEAATGHIEPASTPAASAPREPAVPLASLAAPGRARPAGSDISGLPPEKPIYTRAQLRELYAAHRKGAYVGREQEWARIDADIIAAGREGRVLG